MLASTVQPQTVKRKALHSLRKHWLPIAMLLILLITILVFYILNSKVSKLPLADLK